MAKVSSIRFYTPLNRVLMRLLPTSIVKTRQKDEFNRLGRDSVRKRMLSADDEIDREEVEDKKGYGRALPSDVLSHFKLSNLKESKGSKSELKMLQLGNLTVISEFWCIIFRATRVDTVMGRKPSLGAGNNDGVGM